MPASGLKQQLWPALLLALACLCLLGAVIAAWVLVQVYGRPVFFRLCPSDYVTVSQCAFFSRSSLLLAAVLSAMAGCALMKAGIKRWRQAGEA